MRFACGLILIVLLPFPAAGAPSQALVDGGTLHALEAAQNALHAEPDSEANRLNLASLYLKAGQNRSAVDTLKAYLQAHPDAPKASRLISVAYLREDDYAAAKDAAEHALRSGPRDSAGVQVLAMAELGLGAIDSAETLFREALRLDPRSVEANLQLGLLYTKQRKNLNDAIRLLEKARSLQPNVAGTYAALGSAHLQAGNARQAATYLETAITMAPDTADAYYVLATAYRQLHDDAKVDATLASFNAHKKQEADQRAREMRSRASYEEGVNLLSNTVELDKAYASLSKAATELPTFDPAYYRMAQVSYLKGDLPRALASIREALRLNPLEAEYYYVLARCLEKTDRPAALEAIGKALMFRPGVPDFEDLLRELKGPGARQQR
jgi:tetratricopeptide (TPR) repeat protein